MLRGAIRTISYSTLRRTIKRLAYSMETPINPEAGPSSPPALTAYDKWHKKNGPPVGSKFGARVLAEGQDPMDFNAWDHAELPDDFEERAAAIEDNHMANPVKEELRDTYNNVPAEHWNKFYSKHQEGFFKNRSWLRLEFPELIARSEANSGSQVVLEVGCGAGNTAFPLLQHNENPELVIWATDYSSTAVDVVKANPLYPKPPNGKGILHAAVWDITARPPADSPVTYSLPEGLEPGTVDVITVIYVLSALHPTEWDQAIHNLYAALKPGGTLFIRDYGRHDLAQLRIKKERLLDPAYPGLYIRGDGTRVYFFPKTELEGLITAPPRGADKGSMFKLEASGEDRRLLVNRKLQLKMYRIWLQIKAVKSSEKELEEAA